MQCQKMKRMLISLILFTISNTVYAEEVSSFRTPAKIYGNAYSVKLSVKRKGFEYELPVWVKPDQRESSLDRSLLVEMGWAYPDLKVEELSLSGEMLNVVAFKDQRSDWVGRPQFPKACCYGVIGQDILKDYELSFNPNPPAHIEWTKKIKTASPATAPSHLPARKNGVTAVPVIQSPVAATSKKVFLAELKSLFSTKNKSVVIDHKKQDLSKAPYTLDLSNESIVFPNVGGDSRSQQ